MPRRSKRHSRGEHVFTDPHKEAQYQRELLAQGYSREHSKQTAKHWAQVHQERTDTAVPASQAKEETQEVVPITYSPTPSIKPEDPRTSGAGYDHLNQIMRVDWGDGRVPYYYYNITPQEWDSFQKAESPGRWINAIGNSHEYGPME